MEGHDEGRVAIVQLNDPPMNLFSVRTVNAFERLLPTLADDFGVRCVVIRGGPKHFSGGANLLEMTTNRGVVQENFPNGTTYRGKYVPTEEAFIRQRMALVNMVEAVRFTLLALALLALTLLCHPPRPCSPPMLLCAVSQACDLLHRRRLRWRRPRVVFGLPLPPRRCRLQDRTSRNRARLPPCLGRDRPPVRPNPPSPCPSGGQQSNGC